MSSAAFQQAENDANQALADLGEKATLFHNVTTANPTHPCPAEHDILLNSAHRYAKEHARFMAVLNEEADGL